VSIRRTREPRFPRTGDVYPSDEVDPERFFGEADRSRQGIRKLLQLCKQVERSAALTLTSACESDSLLGAAVAAVEPAPDSGRLMVTVVLAASSSVEDAIEAKDALMRSTAEFREDVSRAIHRKRVPQIVFDVRMAEDVAHE
jgi:ribosome-binding factor A